MNRSSLVSRATTTMGLPMVAVAVLLLLALCGALGGCVSDESEGFAIYLLSPDVPPDSLAVRSHLGTADSPLLTAADIVSYSRATHEVELTAAAYERVRDLPVPMKGRSFAVCVDRSPVYAGAFYSPVSSFSFDGATICMPLEGGGPPERRVLRIELGFPSAQFFTGEDPRDDPAVIRALQEAGKLTGP